MRLASVQVGLSSLAGQVLTTGSPLSQTHCDIVDDWDQDLVDQLTALSKKLDFQIFEDRKFADIGASRPTPTLLLS